MRYLLCEDSTGGFAFWKSVNRLLLDGYFDVVDHSAGRGGLKKKIESLLPLEQCDVILVAIDDIPKSHAIIQSIRKLQKEHGINLSFTNYWCIEEVLVSFADLAKWSTVQGDVVKIGERVRDLIMQGNIGPRIDLGLQDELIALTGGKRVNKEKFYTRLLGMLIDNGLGQFSFTKHESGDDTNTSCWFNDCCDLRIGSGCQSLCGIPVDMTAASERLFFLFENSLLENREFGLKLIEKANRGAI